MDEGRGVGYPRLHFGLVAQSEPVSVFGDLGMRLNYLLQNDWIDMQNKNNTKIKLCSIQKLI